MELRQHNSLKIWHEFFDTEIEALDLIERCGDAGMYATYSCVYDNEDLLCDRGLNPLWLVTAGELAVAMDLTPVQESMIYAELLNQHALKKAEYK